MDTVWVLRDNTIRCVGCGEEAEYVGEHWDEDEGFASAYICKACEPDEFKRVKKVWQNHLYRCRNPYCPRCDGQGLKLAKEAP